MRHAAKHQFRPLKDDRNIPQLISAAKEILDQIVDLFDSAETKLSKLKPADKTQHSDDCLDPQTHRLHARLRKLSLTSFKPRNVLIKAKCGLYQEKNLRRLIEDITEHVDNLIELFPATEPSFTQRCVEEGQVLGEEEDVAILELIVAEQDPELGKALQESKAKGSQTLHFSFAGTANYGLQQGYFTGTQTNSFGFIGGPKGAGCRIIVPYILTKGCVSGVGSFIIFSSMRWKPVFNIYDVALVHTYVYSHEKRRLPSLSFSISKTGRS